MPNSATGSNTSQLQFDFKFGFLLPWTFRFLGGLLILISIFLFFKSPWLSPLLGLPGFLLIFVYEGTEIDHGKKLYREYTCFIVFRTGPFKSYEVIEKVFINKVQQSQKMYSYHTGQGSTFSDVVFNGYLKFESSAKILLIKDKNKDRVLRMLEKISIPLKLKISDHTL